MQIKFKIHLINTSERTLGEIDSLLVFVMLSGLIQVAKLAISFSSNTSKSFLDFENPFRISSLVLSVKINNKTIKINRQ